jgi:hypothetical protein
MPYVQLSVMAPVAVMLIVSPDAAATIAERSVADVPSSAVDVTVHVVAEAGNALQKAPQLTVSTRAIRMWWRIGELLKVDA